MIAHWNGIGEDIKNVVREKVGKHILVGNCNSLILRPARETCEAHSHWISKLVMKHWLERQIVLC